MNFALPSPLAAAPERASPRLLRGTLGWFVACVASVTLAAASVPVVGWAGGVASPAAAMAVPTDSAAVKDPEIADSPVVRPSGRCTNCGTVETVRSVAASGTAPAAYELTVRFRDGSRRISSHSDDAGWRVGDSIMLLGGARVGDRV
ncbi:MAG: hypothetical protein EOO24_17250 [Comamonadaceae bacterium]|nr:MAG: hypothetical protein EOO24_17250 [Comamonadaceae bacterium]